jgi:hypothetical protein
VRSADEVLGRNGHVLQHDLAGGRAAQAHLVLELADRDARPVPLDDEGTDAPVSGGRIGLGEHGVDVGDARTRDPRLAPVQHPLVAVADRPGRHRGGVASGVGLREAVARLLFPRDDRREDALPELIGAVGEEGGDPGAGDERGQRRRPARSGQLLDDQRRRQQVAGVTAVLVRVERTDEAGVAKSVHARLRVRLPLVDLGRVRGDLLLGEPAERRPELLVLLGEQEARGAHSLTS